MKPRRAAMLALPLLALLACGGCGANTQSRQACNSNANSEITDCTNNNGSPQGGVPPQIYLQPPHNF
jgi:hypothetical protein